MHELKLEQAIDGKFEQLIVNLETNCDDISSDAEPNNNGENSGEESLNS
jgi:hypothetical protein